MSEVMLEQGRHGLIGTPYQYVDSLRTVSPDNDSKTNVYLLVYASEDADPRDWHWSISWQVGGGRGQMKAWRHVHIQLYNITIAAQIGPVDEMRYVHWGGMTKPEGVLTDVARKILLGKMSQAMRVRIEELALGVPVMAMRTNTHGRVCWNCQDWVMELARRMVGDKLMDLETLKAAVVKAYKPMLRSGRD